jgi:hypothetical protein
MAGSLSHWIASFVRFTNARNSSTLRPRLRGRCGGRRGSSHGVGGGARLGSGGGEARRISTTVTRGGWRKRTKSGRGRGRRLGGVAGREGGLELVAGERDLLEWRLGAGEGDTLGLGTKSTLLTVQEGLGCGRLDGAGRCSMMGEDGCGEDGEREGSPLRLLRRLRSPWREFLRG